MTADVNLWTLPQHAKDYLQRRRDIPHRDEGYAALLEHLPRSAQRVLDLGTGDGYVVGLLQTLHPEAEFVAADFSPEMLRQARERFETDPRVEVVEHDFDVPLPPSWGEFEAVVSAFAIHHVHDERKRALYGEVFKRLRPGGVFLNLEHVDSATPELHRAFLDAIGYGVEGDDPSNKLAPVEVQLGWLREIGFEHVDCHWKWRELALLAGAKPA
ncbi:MAG: class I SAM-dependent methyltransferase [Acidimicrobiia bacterium]